MSPERGCGHAQQPAAHRGPARAPRSLAAGWTPTRGSEPGNGARDVAERGGDSSCGQGGES